LPRVNGRLLLVGDGIKIPKEGKKCRRSKDFIQTPVQLKTAFIHGAFIPTVGILVNALTSVLAVTADQ